MQKVKCNHCGANLKLPHGLSGDKAKCPKCRNRLSMMTASATVQTTTDPPGPSDSDSQATPPMQLLSADVTSEEGVSSTLATATNDSVDASRMTRLAKMFDFRFKTYLTPWIIRFTWICVLVLSSLWILFTGYLYSTSLVSGSRSGGVSSRSLPSLSSTGGDVDQLLDQLESMQGNISNMSGLLGGNSSGGSFTSFLWSLLLFVTAMVGLLLTVLWSRVMLETIIVIFDIAGRLKSIDEKTPSS